MDRALARKLHAAINAALQDVGRANNVTINIEGAISFDSTSARIKLRAADIGAPKAIESDFARYAAIYGFKPTDLGKELRIGSDWFEISGLKPRSHRYPVLLKRQHDGKMFKYPAGIVQMALAATQGGN